MSHRSKSHRVLRNVGLGIFRRLIPDRELTRIALDARPGLRQRALTVGVVFGLLAAAGPGGPPKAAGSWRGRRRRDEQERQHDDQDQD